MFVLILCWKNIQTRGRDPYLDRDAVLRAWLGGGRLKTYDLVMGRKVWESGLYSLRQWGRLNKRQENEWVNKQIC
jgi:hypothetical protein